MRRAIVHIGMPRTGSTSFQGLLSKLRRRLHRVGMCYPVLRLPGPDSDNKVNHKGLAEALYAGTAPSQAEALALLTRTLRRTRADTLVLSYEDFALQRAGLPVPRLLRETFEAQGFAMEVAIVVKPIAERLNSVYGLRAQLVHEMRSFDGFVRASGHSSAFDYEARIAPWSEAAGGRVTAVPSRDVRSDAPLLTRVLTELRLHDRLAPIMDGVDRTYRSNRSPGPVAVETSRRLCALRAHRQYRDHSRKIGHAIDEACWSRGLDVESFRGDAAESVAAIEARFAPMNERFARAIWGLSWDEVVAPAPVKPPNELAGKPIPPATEATIVEVTHEVMEQFGFRARPLWQTLPANLAERGAQRAARVLDRRWRIT